VNARGVDRRRRQSDLAGILGGFHYAPGGNAAARAGGDDVPAINPLSIWDIGFRPACPDPRGMAYVAGVPGSEGVAPFWVDLYLLNTDHFVKGTSAHGALIADGSRNKPLIEASGRVAPDLNYATAKAIMEGHGKQLLSFRRIRGRGLRGDRKDRCRRQAEADRPRCGADLALRHDAGDRQSLRLGPRRRSRHTPRFDLRRVLGRWRVRRLPVRGRRTTGRALGRVDRCARPQ
jgi:hypothetical protein